MCADKEENSAPKIEKWAVHIAVGMSGDVAAGEYVRSTIHQFVADSGISNFSTEDIANLFAQRCKSVEELSGTTKFIVAGQLTNKKLGAVVVRANGTKVDTEIFESGKVPATLILEPDDLTVDQCNVLFGKALKNVEGKEVEYNLLKGLFNSIYGMCVTNTIRDEVKYDNETGWKEEKITNEVIEGKLLKDEKDAFLSFRLGMLVYFYKSL